MHTRLGTPYYVSPEVLEGRYDKRCDLWSIGVMTYFLLFGYPPFNGENDMELFYKIKCCDFSFPMDDNDNHTIVSDEALEFISRLLRTNPDSRMSIDESLNHEWIQKTLGKDPKAKACPSILKRLTKNLEKENAVKKL
jgi:calcium-dependent protein kinase